MKLLILGGDGMLGHQLVQSLAPRHEIQATLRLRATAYTRMPKEILERAIFGVEAADFASIERVIESARPQAVINAIGAIKQRSEARDAVKSIEINALLPHKLACACDVMDARLIQISTDCVFSGRKGGYREADVPDPEDIYGRSKLLGEVTGPGAITLRSSIIGLELNHRDSLVEWFLAQNGAIKGFRRAVFSGFTTLEMARIVELVLLDHPEKQGLYHVSSAPIDKYTLLTKLRDRLDRDILIHADDDFQCDRSLDSSRFQSEFEYAPPTWDTMLDELSDQIRERDE